MGADDIMASSHYDSHVEDAHVGGMLNDGDAVPAHGTDAIRVLIVDDQVIVRSGLAAILARTHGIDVVAQAGSGTEALRLPGLDEIDVALVDARMPVMSGPQFIAALRRDHPNIACILLTAFDEDDNLLEALQARAAGHLLKDVSAEELAEAIRDAAHGRPVLGDSEARRLMRMAGTPRNGSTARHFDGDSTNQPYTKTVFAAGPDETFGEESGMRPNRDSPEHSAARFSDEHSDAEHAFSTLADMEMTDMDRRIVALAAQGRTNAEIANALFLARGTVKNHLSAIFDRLGVRNRTELAVLLTRHGPTVFDRR
ncbi:response regulator transcription factor [Bifidobacterium tibiigranuli]|jgi:DNA-binding NarL/FixJ family response regulator|uniref:response regulator transcription factor n=1 Tax=Bifidobacterium tibiigranuli TaxID=2172043 RepID=UPI002357852A|nr:response regulator transcription factor [Bifidobacterium tibiigranuli]MCI1221274.1 response regulator transcription factor [Bifidobacterium tibiigranuli]MCI1232235.1 response regulator transcription factor [Bifidobacterium tibiigranuli]